ncbi:SDR family NAD(P)-dependent oxidoreductase [Brevibacterium casei]|uniref:NAD(P)-dependent dehydrogenase, short-chain alcohol dehydrogenase family n=1 Tax=Brevibacterium casei CIP 102111 TaxID=1255625 RepID=A0A2H1JE83_9MICO|nr:SDR family NAD(P)-dependent oxidoreductase [Brevibacterium casei]MCT1549790.1 SDR family oxidoreductase [Brevibacterium casei]MCT1560841.1 SDR family oxidoreductase [Brevibacterium casei]MCT2207376.1 SDR family oxidoreductase [Brevibacterium casei]QPR39014.1 SDR family oxidoreductase [Brevibacterium casei]QPR43180.1 SDR family oxidoreductase [Brevibacterium casei]
MSAPTTPGPAFPDSRTAVLTGVGSAHGIGRHTAHRLAEHGWNLGLIARRADEAHTLAEELTATHGIQALGAGVDVTDSTAIAEAAAAFESGLPQIVALANFAGVSSSVTYFEISEAEWTRVIANNLTATHLVTQAFGRIMAANGVGRIVGLSSVTAQKGGGTYSKTAYAAAKAGIVGLMRGVALELGPFGVTANSISPGPVDTDIMGGPLDDERREAMGSATPLGRISVPEDVSATVAFLISEGAGHITGQTLSINGGLYFH